MLYLIWNRYKVGKLIQEDDGTHTLLYLYESKDFAKARRNGFEGYPAFPTTKGYRFADVLPVFSQRLIPRSRTDFKRFLQLHNLPTDVEYNDLALITNVGVRLPSDKFNIVKGLNDRNRNSNNGTD